MGQPYTNRWPNVAPISKLTLGQRWHYVLGQQSKCNWPNVGPTTVCYLGTSLILLIRHAVSVAVRTAVSNTPYFRYLVNRVRVRVRVRVSGMLFLLMSAQQCQRLQLICVEEMTLSADKVVNEVPRLLKTTKPGHLQDPLVFEVYKHNKNKPHSTRAASSSMAHRVRTDERLYSAKNNFVSTATVYAFIRYLNHENILSITNNMKCL